MKVNILGTEYTIEYKTDEEVAKDIGDNIGECGGYCNAYSKTIVIAKQDTSEESEEIKKAVERRDLRHEIIRAFLHESGLYENSLGADNWAMNEEMVDWIALQFPKLLEAFKEAGAIGEETIGFAIPGWMKEAARIQREHEEKRDVFMDRYIESDDAEA